MVCFILFYNFSSSPTQVNGCFEDSVPICKSKEAESMLLNSLSNTTGWVLGAVGAAALSDH